MKITPDSSLFSALSNLPGPNDVRGRAGGAGFADRLVDPTRKEKDARDAIVRQALRDAAHRQAELRKQESAKPSAAAPLQQKTAVAAATGDTGVVRREAPMADSKPTFVRLGQFVDISV